MGHHQGVKTEGSLMGHHQGAKTEGSLMGHDKTPRKGSQD